MVRELTKAEIHARYVDSGMPGFRRVIVELSKLLVQAWLNDPEGVKFKQDIVEYGLNRALADQGIFFPADWLSAQINPDSFVGSIEFSEAATWENPNTGFQMIFKVPYAPWPENGVTQQELEAWRDECQQWIQDKKYDDPRAAFPAPKNPYIPLASL